MENPETISPNFYPNFENFQKGALLLIDKPLHWTSFDVVKKIRFLLRKYGGYKKIKVGHAGTLDPLATGLLVICTGKMTKSINQFIAEDKQYEGSFVLGSTTPSFDLETEIDATFETGHITSENIRACTQDFIGAIEQVPPIFSAKKIDGKRAYTSAREGKEVEMKAVSVEIKSFEITRIDMPEIDFDIVCSKGTYIRSMAQDFGKALHSGAHLSRLHRSKSGVFSNTQAMTLEDFEASLVSMTEPR